MVFASNSQFGAIAAAGVNENLISSFFVDNAPPQHELGTTTASTQSNARDLSRKFSWPPRYSLRESLFRNFYSDLLPILFHTLGVA